MRQRHPARQFECVQHTGALHVAPAMTMIRPVARNGLSARLLSCFPSVGAMVLALGLAGCHHKPVRPPLPIGVLAPVDLEPSPPVENPPEIALVPEPDLGPLPAGEPPSPPRRRVPPAPKEPEQPVQIATNDAAATLAIGALSAGGEDTAHTSQQALDLINAVLKRIAALSSQLASAQKREIRQARNYLDQAQRALRGGDAEGAHTLATKASLLMDEVEKK